MSIVPPVVYKLALRLSLAVGVDLVTGATGKYTLKTLAEGLYSNDILNVGTKPVTLPNTVAQFALGGESYVQTNFVNKIGRAHV